MTESIPVRYKDKTTTLAIPKAIYDILDQKLEDNESEFTAKTWLAAKGAEAIRKKIKSPSAYARELALIEIIPTNYTDGYKVDLCYSKFVIETDLGDKKMPMKVNIFSALYYALLKKFGSVEAFTCAFKSDSDNIARQKTGFKDF